jgi:hypothetical protein
MTHGAEDLPIRAETAISKVMTHSRTYTGSCHCGAVRFRFDGEEITSGCRCNCSICIRKGIVMSSDYVAADGFELQGEESLAIYQFGDHSMNHYFCKCCGICPFSEVASLPEGYRGRARVGDRRVNLGCVDGLEPLALEIAILDGRSL